MLSFFVGLLVLILIGLFTAAGFFLFPLFLLLTLVFRIAIGFLLAVFVIWLIGKLTLMMITYLHNVFFKNE